MKLIKDDLSAKNIAVIDVKAIQLLSAAIASQARMISKGIFDSQNCRLKGLPLRLKSPGTESMVHQTPNMIRTSFDPSNNVILTSVRMLRSHLDLGLAHPSKSTLPMKCMYTFEGKSISMRRICVLSVTRSLSGFPRALYRNVGNVGLYCIAMKENSLKGRVRKFGLLRLLTDLQLLTQ